MNIIDVFISKLRKIDNNEHLKVNEVICKEELITYTSCISSNNKYAIILDKDGVYKDEIRNRMYKSFYL